MLNFLVFKQQPFNYILSLYLIFKEVKMFSHIMVGANDIEASKKFYDEVLGVLGCEPGALSVNPTGHKRYMYFVEGVMFLISEPIDDQDASHGNGSTIGFSAKDPEMADAWHEAGINSGGTTCEDPP